ncbi:hypothetical protein WN943_021936 [Citrus x changshan-huyou]
MLTTAGQYTNFNASVQWVHYVTFWGGMFFSKTLSKPVYPHNCLLRIDTQLDYIFTAATDNHLFFNS